MARKPQKERVLEYMREFGSITTLDAFNDLGITRLSARIFELKAEGHEIEAKDECYKNRFGENVRYARYSLKNMS